MRNLTTLPCALALLFVLSNATLAGSGPDVNILRDASDPVEITEAGFTDATDWARSFYVSVRGVAPKAIVCVEASLELPELKYKGDTVTAIYRFGEAKKKKKAKSAEPGEVVKVSITPDSDRQLEWLVYGKSSLLSTSESIGSPSGMSNSYNTKPPAKVTLTRGTLAITRVVFADGTEWTRSATPK